MVIKKIKASSKKLNKLILNSFPSAILEDSIIFEEFHFSISVGRGADKLSDVNKNWLVGNKENIFVISLCNTLTYVQKLEQPLNFIIPLGFIHQDFKNLVELNFKNFHSYLLYHNLNNKLDKKNTTSFSKI